MNEKKPLLAYNDRYDDETALKKGHRPAEKTNGGCRHASRTSQSHQTTPIIGATWMSHLPSTILMSSISIPGTHDSAAYTYSFPFISTQTMDITAQLNAGIRYFDLRCGLRNNILEMVHGQALLDLRLDQVLSAMYDFLSANPSEAIIAQIKQDRKNELSTIHFAQAIIRTLSATPDRWRTANTTPMLGELRGRIQLFRRFDLSPSQPLVAYGINVAAWQDNPSRPFTISTPQNVHLTIQDHYSFPDPLSLPSLIARKGGDVSELLDLAATTLAGNDGSGGAGGPTQWFINFTSAFEFNLYYQITPREIAAGAYWAFRWEDGMNARLRAYLDAHTDDDCEDSGDACTSKRRFGILAMDFPEAGAKDLVMAVVRTNFKRSEAKKWWRKWWRAILFVVVVCVVVCAMALSLLLTWPSRRLHV